MIEHGDEQPATDQPDLEAELEAAEAEAAAAGSAARPRFRGNALAEIVGFLALLVGIDLLLLDGNGYWSWQPHPFWILVVFVATQYGSREGLMAAGFSAVALFAGHVPEQRLSQDLYAWLFELARLPLMWAVSAVLLGELRMRQIRERDNLRGDLEAARTRAGTIAAAYESLNETKSQLEVRVAGQLRTVVSMYTAARAVESMEPAQVLTGAIDNVKAVINPQKCSIYLLAGDELEAAIQSGWHRRDRYKRNFRADQPLFQEVIGRARVVCVSDPADQEILAGQGIVAGPLVNPDTGEVRGMIKIEDMGFLDLNLSTVEIFRVLCEWVGAFYANAQRYRQGQLERALDVETQLYAGTFFPRMEQLLRAIAERARFPVAVVSIAVADQAGRERTQRAVIAGSLSAAVQASLRDTDLAFERDDSGHHFDIVLPLAGPSQAEQVGRRLCAAFRERLPTELDGVDVAFDTRAIHEPDYAAAAAGGPAPFRPGMGRP
ncbi:MAG: GAF domain-containing protein [Gammaproteobacteria bacterium]|nr:GAF domain-containing protein [Gammaproteobacteria bacterium]MCP5200271.1 GAF domain-containing protein [Gammaproteobacteria bacterium]